MSTLAGTWRYQSYLIQQAPSAAAPPGPTATAWAAGMLTVHSASDTRVSGGLEFAPGVSLDVEGHVIPASETSSAILVATGEGPVGGPLHGALYWITGAVIDVAGRASIHGSVLGVRGPDARPDDTGGGAPRNTVGTFILNRSVDDGEPRP